MHLSIMSRWLSSVNDLLETLDGTAENVVSDPAGIPTSRGAISHILSRRGMDYDDEEEDYDDDEAFDDDEYSNSEEDEPEEEVVDFSASASPESAQIVMTSETVRVEHSPAPVPSTDVPAAPPQQTSSYTAKEAKLVPKQKAVAPPPAPSSGVLVSAGEESSDNTSDGGVIVKNPSELESVTTEEPSSPPQKEAVVAQKPPKAHAPVMLKPPLPRNSPPGPEPASISKSAPALGTSIVSATVERLQLQLKKYKQETKKSQNEARQLRKHVMQITQELEASESEVKAQQEELQRAAARMEKDRLRAGEEREDLLDEQEEELENQKAQYEKELQEQKDRFEDQIEDLQDRLEVIEEKRMREGGDWTKEVEEALQRERESLKTLNSLKEENGSLKSSAAKLETQQIALQGRLDSMAQSNQTASTREREAEDKLDAALSLHSRQLNQRQARETELEATIADLSAALATSRQKEKSTSPREAATPSTSLKENYEIIVDELETVRAQLTLETERSDALRKELVDTTKERNAEVTDSQARQRQQDRETSELKSIVSRLQASARDRKSAVVDVSQDGDDSGILQQKLEASKQQVASLSEQLIRQQGVAQNSKQEILTLKNRLQSATTRAESAENALAATSTHRNAFDLDGGTAYGGATMRRRVKGGRSKGPSNVRSIRSSLGMNAGRVGGGMEQVAVTIDAIDSFLIDTGSFMKQEPIARLGLVLYLCILHLWSFCLVVFHASTYEDVHGDFGSMSDPGGHGPHQLVRNSHP